MRKMFVCLFWGLVFSIGWGQERALPTDFRQHTLTQFNASLWNATYAQDWNAPNSLSVWTRWQWQDIDGDPTTIFANYTHQINDRSAAALGFLQHNTGVFLFTGGNANYTHSFQLDEGISLMAGMNIFAFQQTVADERFGQEEEIDPSILEGFEGFRMEFSPAFRLLIDRFSLGLAFENAVGLNLSGEGNTSNFQTVMGSAAHDFPVTLFGGMDDSFVRPVVYVKSIPDGDTQFGLNGLFSTSKFWVQGGYNSFYGVSGGLGITLAKAFSIGGLMEFGTDSSLDDENPTLELIASYRFGKPDGRKKVVDFDVDKEVALEQERIRKEKEAELERQREIELQKERDSLAEAQIRADQMAKDSLAQKVLQKERDSLAKLQSQKVELRPNEKYEEIQGEDGLEPGFYLIANVYGTKKYFESFMKSLRDKGLEPKSFYRKSNTYNYVYLERYNTMDEARRARDGKFNGRYTDKTWIFRVRGN